MDRERIFGKLLRMYGPCAFESKLKHALLRSDFHGLSSEVLAAIERSLAGGHQYLASQLLPVLARWRPEEAKGLFGRFTSLPAQTPNPLVNVAEAWGYIKTAESKAALKKLSAHGDNVVAEQARESMKRLSLDS